MVFVDMMTTPCSRWQAQLTGMTSGVELAALRSPNSKPRHNHGSGVIGGILNCIQRRVNLRRVKIDKAQRALRKSIASH